MPFQVNLGVNIWIFLLIFTLKSPALLSLKGSSKSDT